MNADASPGPSQAAIDAVDEERGSPFRSRRQSWPSNTRSSLGQWPWDATSCGLPSTPARPPARPEPSPSPSVTSLKKDGADEQRRCRAGASQVHVVRNPNEVPCGAWSAPARHP
jgi:hypothetical protein